MSSKTAEYRDLRTRCFDCQFWKPDDKSMRKGDCRFYPPEVLVIDSKTMGFWPKTEKDDWCGKGKQ